jgi:hypothetical protein
MVGMCLAASYRLDKEPDLSLSENRAWVSGKPVRGFSGRISLSHGWPSLSRGRISLSLLPDHSLSPSLSRAHRWSGCVWSPDIELGGGSVTNEYNGVKRDFAASFFLCFKTTTFVLMKG